MEKPHGCPQKVPLRAPAAGARRGGLHQHGRMPGEPGIFRAGTACQALPRRAGKSEACQKLLNGDIYGIHVAIIRWRCPFLRLYPYPAVLEYLLDYGGLIPLLDEADNPRPSSALRAHQSIYFALLLYYQEKTGVDRRTRVVFATRWYSGRLRLKKWSQWSDSNRRPAHYE